MSAITKTVYAFWSKSTHLRMWCIMSIHLSWQVCVGFGESATICIWTAKSRVSADVIPSVYFCFSEVITSVLLSGSWSSLFINPVFQKLPLLCLLILCSGAHIKLSCLPTLSASFLPTKNNPDTIFLIWVILSWVLLSKNMVSFLVSFFNQSCKDIWLKMCLNNSLSHF